MPEAGRIFEVAEQRQAVPPLWLGGFARAGVAGNSAWPNKWETAASVPVRRIERRVRRKGNLRKPATLSGPVVS